MPGSDSSPQPHTTSRPYWAQRLETSLGRRAVAVARRLGWRERIEPFVGYGLEATAHGDGWVRILGRVVISPRKRTHEVRSSLPGQARDLREVRGWRSFFLIEVPGAVATIYVGDTVYKVTCDVGGYLDVVLPAAFEAGWRGITLVSRDGSRATAGLQVLSRSARVGLISDIDDTVMVTSVPRFFLAVWNSLARHESARAPVPGMAALYRTLAEQYSPGSLPMFYLSTGAWNIAPAMIRFIKYHGLPSGSLLMTDFGPTNTGIFRSGPVHKHRTLARLTADFPDIRWILVGDDGQHDPVIYDEYAKTHPDRVEGILIRQLSPTQAVLAHGTVGAYPTGRSHDEGASAHPDAGLGHEPRSPRFTVRGKDGFAIIRKLESLGVLPGTRD